jgi:hypothetical protein
MSPRLTTPAALCALLLGLMALTQTGILGQYEQTILSTMGIYMILAASLNLVNGYMGEFSCGHAGFMAVGHTPPPSSGSTSSSRTPFSASPCCPWTWPISPFP